MHVTIKIAAIFVVYLLFSEGCTNPSAKKPTVIRQPAVTKSEDIQLIDEINNYRIENGLSKIPVSASLNMVAQAHVKDLVENKPDQGNCNMHSWSDKGSWKACCYTDDAPNPGCMWDKPREITSYKGNGYEIAASASKDINIALAIDLWKNSPPHKDVILNKNEFSNYTWNAIGAAIYMNYAVVWFGEIKE